MHRFIPPMKPNIHISILKNPEKSIDFFLTSIKLLCNIYFAVAKYILQCRCSSVVEHQPSKLDMWVRFPSPASTKSPQVEPEGFFIEQARPRPQGSGSRLPARSVRGLRSTGARSPHHLLSKPNASFISLGCPACQGRLKSINNAKKH